MSVSQASVSFIACHAGWAMTARVPAACRLGLCRPAAPISHHDCWLQMPGQAGRKWNDQKLQEDREEGVEEERPTEEEEGGGRAKTPNSSRQGLVS